MMIIFLILLTGGAALLAWHQLDRLTHARRRFESRLSTHENRWNKQIVDAIEADNRRALLRQSVDSGTGALEMVHRAISSTTFEVIDRFSKSERFRWNSRQAREIHDDASRDVYRSIRVANKHVHALANVIIRQKRESRRRKGRGEITPVNPSNSNNTGNQDY